MDFSRSSSDVGLRNPKVFLPGWSISSSVGQVRPLSFPSTRMRSDAFGLALTLTAALPLLTSSGSAA